MLSSLLKFRDLGLDDEKAPPPTPVAEYACIPLRDSVWDVSGDVAARQMQLAAPYGRSFGVVVRTRAEAAAGVRNIYY